MSFWELMLLAVGLAMDAFAISICIGLSQTRISLYRPAITGLYFGSFQAIMPLIGYLLASLLKNWISAYDHWIAFFLLLLIGINLIRESRKGANESYKIDSVKSMLLLSAATSIDALAVGITLAFLNVNIYTSVLTIGLVTFLISLAGVYIGFRFGAKLRSHAVIIGGIILILIGIKILVEHLVSA